MPIGEFEGHALRRYLRWLRADTHCLVHVAVRTQGLFVARDNPKKVRGIADLTRADLRFVNRPEGSGTRMVFEEFMSGVLVKRAPLDIDTGSNETIKQAVMAGMGISFLSLHTVGMELRYGLLAVLDVHGAPVVRAWNCVHTLSKLLSPAAEALRYFILEHGETHLAEHDRLLLQGNKGG